MADRPFTVVQAPITRAPDPWTPVALLEDFLAMLRRGEIRCGKGLMVFFLEEDAQTGRVTPHFWSTGLSSAEQIAFCELLKGLAIEDWRSPS